MSHRLSKTIDRIHWLGLSTSLLMVVSVVLIRVYPEKTWTQVLPVLTPTPAENRHNLDDVLHWKEIQSTLPTRQATIDTLRDRLSIQTSELEDWIIQTPKSQAASSSEARKKRLRSIAEALHACASEFGLSVELIRIGNEDPDSLLENMTNLAIGSETATGKLKVGWCPMTLRIKGTYPQTCQFVEQLGKQFPSQCRKLNWRLVTEQGESIDAANPPLQLEIVIAFAIAVETATLEGAEA